MDFLFDFRMSCFIEMNFSRKNVASHNICKYHIKSHRRRPVRNFWKENLRFKTMLFLKHGREHKSENFSRLK